MKKITALTLILCMLLTACGKPETPPTEAVTVPVETAATVEATEPPTEAPTTEPPTEPQPEIFTLTFVGDCTLGNDPSMDHMDTCFIQTIGADYDYPFRQVVSYFENDDFTMANLEGVLGREGYPANKMFRFRGPAEYTQILTGSSVEAVTLANNHTLDFGLAGFAETKRLLDEAELPYVEVNSSRLVTTESGLTIGLYAASFVIDQEDLEAEVAALREQGAEIVIFAIHWGGEGVYRAYAHNIQQAHDAIDAGVDIVYGTHPHVLQTVEAYNGGMVYYSLGNFAFGGNHFPKDMDSAILQQQVIRDIDGSIRLGELTIIPCSISGTPVHNNFQPIPLEEGTEAYNRVLSKLDGSFAGQNLVVKYPEKPTEPPATEAPTAPPATEAPATPPATEAPATPPATEAPATPPATEAPAAPPASSQPTFPNAGNETELN